MGEIRNSGLGGVGGMRWAMYPGVYPWVSCNSLCG